MDPRVPLFELYFDSIAGPPIQGCPDGAPLFVGSSTGAHCAVPLSVLPGEWGRCVSACHFRLKASLDGGISLRAKQGDVWVLRPKPHTGPAAEWECLAAGRSMPVSFGTRIAIPGSGGSRFSRILHWRLEKAGAGVAADATPAAPKPQPSAGKKRSLAEQQAVAGSPSSKRLQAAGNARKHQQQQQQQQQEHAGDAPKVRPQHPEQRSQHAEQQQQQQQEQQEQQQRRKQTKPQRLHPQMLQHKAASGEAAAPQVVAADMSPPGRKEKEDGEQQQQQEVEEEEEQEQQHTVVEAASAPAPIEALQYALTAVIKQAKRQRQALHDQRTQQQLQAQQAQQQVPLLALLAESIGTAVTGSPQPSVAGQQQQEQQEQQDEEQSQEEEEEEDGEQQRQQQQQAPPQEGPLPKVSSYKYSCCCDPERSCRLRGMPYSVRSTLTDPPEGAFTAAGPFLAAGMSTHLRHMAERQGADPACVGDASQWLQFRCGRRRAFYHRLLRAVLCYYRHSSRSVGQAVTSRRHFASAVNGSPGWRSTFRLLDGTLLKDALKNA